MDVLRYTLDALMRRLETLPPPTADHIPTVITTLGVPLPPEFNDIAAVFRGGPLLDYHQFPWDPADPAGVIAMTRTLRAAGLRSTDVALGRIGKRLYFWDASGHGTINTADLRAENPLALKRPLAADHISAVFHFSYTGLLLDVMEGARYAAVRKQLDQRFAALTQRAARKWRHRWAPHERERIDEILRRGVRAADRLPTCEDDAGYTDLRGVVLTPWTLPPPPFVPDRPPALRPRTPLERVDLSFCESKFYRIDAHDCRFRGATVGALDCRFTSCDFTLADTASANHRILSGDFTDCTFTGARLAQCTLNGSFTRCDFTGSDLWWAGHGETRFIDCIWTHCRFGGDATQWHLMREQAFPLL